MAAENPKPSKPNRRPARKKTSAGRESEPRRMQRAQATIDVRATERFLRWSLKHNQQAIDALTHQREALLAALEVVTQQASKPR